MNPIRIRSLSFLAFALAGTALVAQESTGQIVGTVKTRAGEPLAGVEVRFAAPTLQGVRTVVTDASGAFRAPLLPPGTYTLTTAKGGFVGGRAEGVVLGLGQVLRQDLLMAPVQVAEKTVEVIAAAASVDKSDVKTSTNISSEMMDVLPRFTRGMDTAALLAPGVALNGTMGNRVQMRGAPTTGNRWLLNGTDIADNVFANTDGRTYYVDDSVAESQIISSPVNAKFGGFLGGIINAITKSGGNEFTGIFRANISRNSWSAIAPLGMRPNSTARPNPGTDDLNRNYTLWVGGPILKDKLWFAASTKLDPSQSTPNNLNDVTGLQTGDSPASARGAGYVPATTGMPFNITSSNQFYELKLTYAINENHSVELAGNRNVTDQRNRFYVASPDPTTLVPQRNENSYYTAAYRGLLGNSLTLEARYAKKHQLLAAGADPAQGDPIRARYSNGSYYIFQNGIFDKTDGGDNRDIKTYTAGITWFSPRTFLGTHTVEAGFELLRQDRQAANAQSPTGRQFLVWGRNADGTYRVAGLSTSATAFSQNYVLLYSVDKGVAKTDTDGYYLNDTLAINDHWQVMGGLRFDKTKAADTLGSQTVSSNATSPRFQVRWDPKGNQAWLFTASWARYAGKLNDSFTNRFTRAGNPISESYGWAGAANNAAPYAVVTNLANWSVSAATLRSYSGPLSRFADTNTKAPINDETSFAVRHTYTDGSYINLTYTKRTGKHFFNDFYTIGDEVQVPLIYSTGMKQVYAERWATDDRLTRDYNSFEVDFLSRFNEKWSLGGNYTLASLQGNSEGSEGNNPPVSGDVIGDFESVHASRGRDFTFYAPYGYLSGDVKHRARIYLNYVNKSSQGALFNASLMFNYTGGSPYSLTRDLYFEAYDDALAAGSTIASQYASYGTYNRYYGPRGIGRFNDIYNFDLKLGTEIPVWRKVRYFVELTVFNVFNHWQLSTFSTTNVSGSSLATTNPLAGYQVQNLTQAGVAGGNATGWGTYGYSDYVGGRSMAFSTGIKW
ncbi:hypothetical protein GETHPA_12070 [Geothrix rubra]|uniref:TonB-dependent receptor n=1 Tax=Geothrix rubra TaxID=2927977 RepID=A0ABQ5Q5P7_9BACT|nr:TonB-dependent receptor [Geothrix rubra]GLH69674.1 hypothetical protein GETHPA_12070 [Geothrix rubra]